MKATEMYVEQIIIGMLVLGAIWLFTIGIFCNVQLTGFDWFRNFNVSLENATLIIIAAYLLGMVYDRVADTILDKIDRHNRLRFALKDTAKNVRYGMVPEIEEDPFPEASLRVLAMKNGEAVAEHMSYLRSRMRLLRALCTLIPLYTVIATLYLVADWGHKYDRQLWVCSGAAMVIFYGMVFLLNVIGWPQRLPRPPKTNDLGKVNQYADSHIVVDDGCNDKSKVVWKWEDGYQDPAWGVFVFIIAWSIGILVISGNNLQYYWSVPLAGFLLTLLVGWTWLRVSKTFMTFLVDFNKSLD